MWTQYNVLQEELTFTRKILLQSCLSSTKMNLTLNNGYCMLQCINMMCPFYNALSQSEGIKIIPLIKTLLKIISILSIITCLTCLIMDTKTFQMIQDHPAMTTMSVTPPKGSQRSQWTERLNSITGSSKCNSPTWNLSEKLARFLHLDASICICFFVLLLNFFSLYVKTLSGSHFYFSRFFKTGFTGKLENLFTTVLLILP